MNAYGLAPLILVFPAIGFLFNALFGRRFVETDAKVGERWTGWFATFMALGSFVIAILLYLTLNAHHHEARIVHILDWINIPSAGFNIPWAIQVDTLSVTMMLVVTGVGSLIHIYAIGYMHGDKDFSRFFAYLNLFLFFMLILITGSSYLMLFVGWEGVGLCSFLLIGFWFSDWKNVDAARKAFVANRVGDFAMILAMILTFYAFGSMQFDPVFEHALEIFEHEGMVTMFGQEFTIGGVLTAICVLFLIGATGKSAQIPLYVWLPDAMAGPTPVSALIHAATMVTSGIYLIVRSNVLFEIVRETHYQLFDLISANNLVALVGALTAAFAGLIAFTQFDVKKVLAYSTVSQLGFMVAAIGMGGYVAGMFHLITHAFFKALLFMGSGSIIHGMEHGHHELHHAGHGDEHDEHNQSDHFDPQDMRTMGGLRHKMPTTFWTYIIGSLALAGIAPFAGFWSKDEILAHASANAADQGFMFTFVYWVLGFAAFCTAFYMARQVKMVFFGKPRHEAAEHAHESPWEMTLPLVVLSGLAILGGLLNFPKFGGNKIGNINLALEHWLEYSIESFHLTEESVVHMPHTPTSLVWMVAIISSIVAIGAILLAWFVVYKNRPQNATDPDPIFSGPFNLIFSPMSKLPFNSLYMGVIVPAFNRFAHFCGIVIDWEFYHDFIHEDVIRGTYLNLSKLMNATDRYGVDGLVRGSGHLATYLSGQFRKLQSGFIRNYALGVVLGVVLIVLLFVLPALMG